MAHGLNYWQLRPGASATASSSASQSFIIIWVPQMPWLQRECCHHLNNNKDQLLSAGRSVIYALIPLSIPLIYLSCNNHFWIRKKKSASNFTTSWCLPARCADCKILWNFIKLSRKSPGQPHQPIYLGSFSWGQATLENMSKIVICVVQHTCVYIPWGTPRKALKGVHNLSSMYQ